MRIAIIEDDKFSLRLTSNLVRRHEVDGKSLETVSYDCSAKFCADMESIDFDVVIVDFHMPLITGIGLTERMLRIEKHKSVPVIMITADCSRDIKLQALRAGIVEFLNKPIDTIELKVRLSNVVRLRLHHLETEQRAQHLQIQVDRAVAEIRHREEELIQRLSLAGGYKDNDTQEHTKRVAKYVEGIALELGLEHNLIRDLRLASYMHDIGKVGIRDSLLLKAGSFTENERHEMEQHTIMGEHILSGSKSNLLKMAGKIALSHHECWDGSGYPNGLRGEDIPLEARIVSVADCFDALTTERPYKHAWPIDKALQFLSENAGSRYDPAVVQAFKRYCDTVEKNNLSASAMHPIGKLQACSDRVLA